MDLKNSMILANMMSNSGGTKTLNLVSVGGATYDSDYIFERTNYSDTSKYFETKENIDLLNINNSIELKIKCWFNSATNGLLKRQNDFNFSFYYNAMQNLWCILSGSLAKEYVLQKSNRWLWIKVIRNSAESNPFFHYYISLDGENYTEIYVGYSAYDNKQTDKMIFGVGSSTGTLYGLNGKIDFKETDIIINGQSVLWI